MEALIGEWVMTTSENLDEIMKKLGMNFFNRKLAKTVKPNIKIEKNGNEWIFKLKTPFKNYITRFEMDKPFDDTCMNGKSVTSLVKAEGNKMIVEQRDENNNLILLVIREVNQNDEYVVTMKADDVVCVRTHTRVTA